MIWTYFYVCVALSSLMHVCISIYQYELSVYCALCGVCKYIYLYVCVCVCVCVCVGLSLSLKCVMLSSVFVFGSAL